VSNVVSVGRERKKEGNGGAGLCDVVTDKAEEGFNYLFLYIYIYIYIYIYLHIFIINHIFISLFLSISSYIRQNLHTVFRYLGFFFTDI